MKNCPLNYLLVATQNDYLCRPGLMPNRQSRFCWPGEIKFKKTVLSTSTTTATDVIALSKI